MTGAEVLLVCFLLSLLAAGVNGVWQFYTKQQKRLPGDPKRVLDARFAKGEIDEAEYARRLAVLQMGPPLDYLDYPAVPPAARELPEAD